MRCDECQWKQGHSRRCSHHVDRDLRPASELYVPDVDYPALNFPDLGDVGALLDAVLATPPICGGCDCAVDACECDRC